MIDGMCGSPEACPSLDPELPPPVVWIDNWFPEEYWGLTFSQLPPQDQAALIQLGWTPEEWDRENALGNITDLRWTAEDPVMWGVVVWSGLKLIPAVVAFVCLNDGDCTNEAQNLARLRQAYENEVRGLREEAQRRLAAGESPEAVARWVHRARRALGVEYKGMTPPDVLEQIYARNIAKYGDPLGPSIEWLLNQGKTWMDIIESGTRPGGQDIIKKILGQ
jgi:hypothetical protein